MLLIVRGVSLFLLSGIQAMKVRQQVLLLVKKLILRINNTFSASFVNLKNSLTQDPLFKKQDE